MALSRLRSSVISCCARNRGEAEKKNQGQRNWGCTGCMCTSVSSVVEFQRWWVLKSKVFVQESTCSKEILIPSTLNDL